MAAIPYMPLYVADYMSDAAHLSTIEHGAYLLLIMTYWQRGEALPADDKKLARICRLGPREWGRVKGVLSEFFQVDCSTWSHKRIEFELQNVRAKSLKKRNGGLARAKQMHSNSGSAAKQSDTDADTEETLAKASDADALSDKVFWSGAVGYLGGKRSLIGKWCKQYGKPETAKAITAAQLERAVDPVSYIERVLRGSARQEAAFTGPC